MEAAISLENNKILVQLNLPSKSFYENINQNKTLVGVLNPYQNTKELGELVKKKAVSYTHLTLPTIYSV